MKRSKLNPIDQKRLYEVTEVMKGDAYTAEELVGMIIAPKSSLHATRTILSFGKRRPCYQGQARVVRCTERSPKLHVCFYAVMLRPLTIKEQKKINETIEVAHEQAKQD